AAGASVAARPREIDVLVGGVEVAHHQHPLARAAVGLQHLEQPPIERELVGHAAVVALLAVAVGEVDVGDHQAAEASDLHPSLAVEARLAEAGPDRIGGAPREQAHAAVAPALGRDEAGVEAPRAPQRGIELLGQGAHLLHPEHVGPQPPQLLAEARAVAGPQPVDVPREHPEAHGAGWQPRAPRAVKRGAVTGSAASVPPGARPGPPGPRAGPAGARPGPPGARPWPPGARP